MSVVRANLEEGLSSGFLDGNLKPLERYNPKLVINNYKKGVKVLSTIERELSDCNEFYFSVAFITNSGVQSLINILDNLAEKGIKGKIITSQYQDFTQPVALHRLLEYKNIQLRIVTEGNFHAKGYIFKKEDETYSFIIGSSNMTQAALSENKEWNLRISSLKSGSVMQNLIEEFHQTFEEAVKVTPAWIDQYEKIYNQGKRARNYNSLMKDQNLIQMVSVQPNKMQTEALINIERLRKEGKDKGLLISATGTGKTYLAAFDVAKFQPKKFLFVVHRENIARNARESFKRVLGYNIKTGLLTGTTKDLEADYLFCTVQTLSKENTLKSFGKKHFDYIVIDEVHKAGAPTYQRIIEHFKPEFLLGMTATPERTDNFDIFKSFGYNIAYEIRLERALEEKMLTPFHYFGIQDITIDGQVVDDVTEFNKLVSQERVDRIIEVANHYGHDGDRVKGLIFCSRKEEAWELSHMMNDRGLKTIALTGDDSETAREAAIEAVEAKSREEGLDYIITVDIFNEGVDIPTINQIIMLRPTQSAIIFVQQLGRGLRKAPRKEFLTVIDFIGNYNNNYLVPIALYGDRTYNKDNVRKLLNNGSSMLPGCSTVNFDEITKKKIYESIDGARFDDIRIIKENYLNLKYKLGRIPSLKDFDDYGSIDPVRIFENKGVGSYYKFLSKYDKEDYTYRATKAQELYLDLISRKFAQGKRPQELELIKIIVNQGKAVLSHLMEAMTSKYDHQMNQNQLDNLVNIFTSNFLTGSQRNTYKDCIFIKPQGNDYCISDSFKESLKDDEFKRLVMETVDFGLYRNSLQFGQTYGNNNLCLYEKYTYEDVCRLLNWENSVVSLNIGGYKYDEKTKTFPVFINYEKSNDISATTAYEDRFINPNQLIALSKSGRTPKSKDIQTIYNAEQLGVSIELFVRKNKDDVGSKEFYYLGRINAMGNPEVVQMKGTSKMAVEILYQLETPVREDIYRYIIN